MDALLAVARFIHYAAALQLFGIATLQSLLAPTGLRLAIERPSRVASTISALLLLLSGLLWLSATAGNMGDGWADTLSIGVVSTVLTATSFGHIWGPHLLLGLVLVLLLAIRANWALIALLSTVALGMLGLVGHAAIDSGLLGLLNQTSQILHLLSSGFWLGSLLPLLFCLKMFADPALQGDADTALRRFSGLGHLAVAILLLSGGVNTWFVLGAAAPDLSVPYQRLLLAKIGIAGLMCILAIINRYAFVPNISSDGPGARQLAHGTVAEIVLGAGILAIVGVIGAMAPT